MSYERRAEFCSFAGTVSKFQRFIVSKFQRFKVSNFSSLVEHRKTSFAPLRIFGTLRENSNSMRSKYRCCLFASFFCLIFLFDDLRLANEYECKDEAENNSS